jgi:PBP1b-binding outer membrane lipoprotein LpoB
MKISTILAILISALFISSCKEEPTKPQTETNLTLEVLDKSFTQVRADVKAMSKKNIYEKLYNKY